MRPNRNGHTSPHTGKHLQYVAALALTLALAAGLIACEESPADPAPASALQAAGTTSDEDHPWRAIGRGLLHLADDLGLTAEQQAEIERIRTELREKHEPLREQIRSTLGIPTDESPRRFAFREATEEQREALRPIFEQLRADRRAAMAQVTALLTPEQQETLDSLRAERRSRGPRPGGSFRGPRSS